MSALPPPFRGGDLLRIRGERWQVGRWQPYGDGALLEVTGHDRGNRGTCAAFLLPYEPVERLPSHTAPRRVRPAEWRRVARTVLAEATPSWQSLRSPLRAVMTIAPFQLEPALALLRGHASRALIADEVGLGKTIQAGIVIAEVLAREPDARAIVVCPAGLREQWRDELRHRFGLAPAILDASAVAQISCGYEVDVNPWTIDRVVLTSIDYVKRPEVMRSLEGLLWDVAVFDEAHALGGASDRTLAATLLGTRARRVVLLTATPHAGDEDAFRRMCAVGRLGDDPLLVFRRTRADAGVPGRRRSVRIRVRPSADEQVLHRELAAYARRVCAAAASPGAALAMAVLTRRAASSAASLARSIERRLDLLGTAAGAAGQMPLPFLDDAASDKEPDTVLAARGLADEDEERRALARLLDRARLAAGRESKLAALLRLLRRCHEPAVVFTEYRDTLAHIAAQLPSTAVLLHGGMTASERRQSTRAFNEGIAPLLLATDAASEGLNLHARCRLVISLELPWTPVRLEQRIGRVDRIGQARTVHAVVLLGRRTEEAAHASRFSSRVQRAGDSLRNAAVPPAGVSEAAMAEGARLALARTLLSRGASRLDPRPPMCTLRPRPHRSPFTLAAWRVSFADQDGRLVWEWTCGLQGAALYPPDLASRAIRAGYRRDLLLQELAPAHDLLLARERAIVGELQQRHARLAAGLLQPGLFDLRATRAAAARSALLEEALARSASRLRALQSATRLHAEERHLLFVVTLR